MHLNELKFAMPVGSTDSFLSNHSVQNGEMLKGYTRKKARLHFREFKRDANSF